MPKRKTQTIKVARNLPVVLNDNEKREYGRKLADLEHNKEQIELEKKAASDTFKEQLSAVDAGIRRFVTSIRDGIERREVECEWVYFWESLTKQLVRCDTDEVIERDMIGQDERQIGLDGIDTNADEKP